MAKGKQPSKPSTSLFQGIFRFFRKGKQAIERWLQGWVIKVKRRSQTTEMGFVLPTVTMVLLVVVLLSLAITFRAFDRAKDARFTKVSEKAFNAAAPALDRARAKVTQALQEVSQISDEEIYNILTTYTFGDEDQVQVRYDVDGSGGIELNGADGDGSTLKDNEAIETAWRFPFDTDNNGVFDSFSIYGIFFRTPTPGEVRSPLDSRTLPLPSLGLSGQEECAFYSGGVDSLVTDEGLTPNRGKFKKSIFAYTVTFPVTETMIEEEGLNGFEAVQGSPGFAPLEYQQDWSIKPLNGVVYIDDLEITPGPEFNLNVGLYAESNLITSPFNNNIRIFQISGRNSCFYDPDLSKIVVGGNVINGMVGNDNNQNPVNIDLYQGAEADIREAQISNANQSTGDGAYEAMYNDKTYRARLENLVQSQLVNAANSDPPTVRKLVDQLEEEGVPEEQARQVELERYFKARLRKVPIAESPIVEDAPQTLTATANADGELIVPDAWADRPGEVNIIPAQLEATEPTEETQKTGIEEFIGDRVLVGNNQPALEYIEGNWQIAEEQLGIWTDTGNDRDRLSRVEILSDAIDKSRGGFWERAAARLPKTYVEGVGGLRIITGGGYYDRNLSFLPPPITPGTFYDDPATAATEEFPVVWPDTMPMSPVDDSEVYDNLAPGWINVPNPFPTGNAPQARGDLRMRATAVYHYAEDAINPSEEDLDQEPIACVSSYYDPSTSRTAENMLNDEWGRAFPGDANGSADGRSNNGVVYGPPETQRPANASTLGANGLLTGGVAELDEQANYVFPDGRFANQPLREALLVIEEERSIDQKAAIDATLCAYDILENNIQPQPAPVIPHLAIREVAFLDGRQVKAVEADATDTPVDETFTLSSPLTGVDAANLMADDIYDLPLEDRQPLEIRATQIDLNALRNAEITNTTAGIDQLNPEYLLPYSGLIYASRDDALRDLSNREEKDDGSWDEELSKALSPVDYLLDPTRRPNGILLVNGASLGRGNEQSGLPAGSVEDVLKEKGLTLVSNLPVYIKGEFNFHDQQEFQEELDDDFGNFYNRADLDPDFACREGDPIRAELGQPCNDGDNWRPATVLSDAITLLSDNFRLGFRNEGDFDLRNNAGNTITTDPATRAAVGIGYDLLSAANGGTNGINLGDTVNENDYGIDLNGNGNFTDNNVPETEVTARAARQLNGFNGYNDFGVSGLSSASATEPSNFRVEDTNNDDVIDNTDGDVRPQDNDYRTDENDAVNSSYFNNFVTPIQRRGRFAEYVMEYCPKLPVSACQPEDWEILNGTTVLKPDVPYTQATLINVAKGNLTAGTTAQPPSNDLQRFPRRVAFLRDTNFNLVLDGNNRPIPLGIKGGSTKCFASTAATHGGFTCDAGTPDAVDNALWFQTRNGNNRHWGAGNPLWYYDLDNKGNPKTFTAPDPAAPNVGTVQQPLLVPVLQIHATTTEARGGGGNFPLGDQVGTAGTRWLPIAEETEYNLVLASGDVPGRPDETNGGLPNLPRFLENWEFNGTTGTIAKISGSFVQSGRSEYATAPFLGIFDAGGVEIFGEEGADARYNIFNSKKRTPYFVPMERNWGFDVGLLAQPPDYFSRKFARLEKDQEGNYKIEQLFREVGKDDPWVKGLLCGKLTDPVNPDDEDEDIENATQNAFATDLRESLKCDTANNRTNAYDD